jgi:hypothetical protein
MRLWTRSSPQGGLGDDRQCKEDDEPEMGGNHPRYQPQVDRPPHHQVNEIQPTTDQGAEGR